MISTNWQPRDTRGRFIAEGAPRGLRAWLESNERQTRRTYADYWAERRALIARTVTLHLLRVRNSARSIKWQQDYRTYGNRERDSRIVFTVS